MNRTVVTRGCLIVLTIFYFLLSVKGSALGSLFDWFGWTPFIEFLRFSGDFIVALLLGFALFQWITWRYCLAISVILFFLFFFNIIPRLIV